MYNLERLLKSRKGGLTARNVAPVLQDERLPEPDRSNAWTLWLYMVYGKRGPARVHPLRRKLKCFRGYYLTGLSLPIELGSRDLSQPELRLKDLDRMGIDYSVMYPSTLYATMASDPELEAASRPNQLVINWMVIFHILRWVKDWMD